MKKKSLKLLLCTAITFNSYCQIMPEIQSLQTTDELDSDENGITRSSYVHHNQLRQQILQITGPAYDAARMNLGSLYALSVSSGSTTVGSLVNSSTIGNLTLGTIVNSSTIGNITLAAMISNMQSSAHLAGTTASNLSIVSQNPSGLISTNGSTITFNVAGTYLITGSILGNSSGGLTNATLQLSDNHVGGNVTVYSVSNVTTSFGNLVPVSIPYATIYTVAANDSIQFSSSGSWSIRTITINILRIQ